MFYFPLSRVPVRMTVPSESTAEKICYLQGIELHSPMSKIHSGCNFVTGCISLDRITFFFISQRMSLLGLLHVYYLCECCWHSHAGDDKQHQVSSLYFSRSEIQIPQMTFVSLLSLSIGNNFQKIALIPKENSSWTVHYEFLSKPYFKQK